MDYVETMAAHAVRMIVETRRRGATSATVTDAAFDRWNQLMRRQGKAVYHRPQTITGSRRFSRRSPLSDYAFQQLAGIHPIAVDKEYLEI